MTTVQVVSPDELAAEAQAAGLLSDSQIAALLREQLGRQKSSAFLDAMDQMTAAAEEVGLTPEEVTEEIHAMRAEKGRAAA